MAYIGQGLPADVFAGFTVDKFTGTGVASQTLTLTKAPLGETALLVTIDGVVQEPTDDFTVSGTTVTLVGTAANGSEINVTHLSGTVPNTLASAVDVNGLSDGIILDADGDSTISADTDDQIDFKVGGTDQIKLTDGVLAPTTTNDVDLGSTSLRFKDVAISNDIAHLDNAGTARTLYDRSANMLGNTGTNLTAYSLYVGGTDTANQLDDYEEGEWTIGLEDSSGNAMTLNSTYRKGFYTKIGHRVIVSGYADVSSVGSASGNMRLTGLPFTVINNVAGYSALTAYPENMNLTAGYSIVGYTGVNSSRIILCLTDTTTGQSHLQASELTTGNLIFSAVYVTNE